MHMGVTGWLGEAPDEVPPMPVTQMMLARQQRRAGPLETALARSAASDIREAREAAASAPDPDERAANLIARGYTPGLASQLAQRLGDTMAGIEAENAKIEQGKRRQEHLHRAHAAGQITAWDIVRGQDFDEGDPGRVAQLERRAESLKRQMADAQEIMAPPQRRDLDGVEAASRHAHQVFAEVTRARMAEARRPEPRPFASVSRGAGGSTEHTGPDCPVCAEGRRAEAARGGEVVGVPFRSARGSGEMVRAVEGGIVSIR
jgi:hypothetical protein